MKPLWIVLVGLAAMMILIIIVAYLVPSFEDRRRGGNNGASPTSRSSFTTKTKRKLWLAVVIILLVTAAVAGMPRVKKLVANYLLPSTISYPIAAEAKDVWIQKGETKKVKIHPDCWSGWINLPPDAQVVIDAPGEMERLFWTGERVLIKNKNTRWLGTVPHCSSRIRGTEGEVTISVR